MEVISRYIKFTEAIKSPTAIRYAIDNTPAPVEVEAMRRVCMAIYDPLCDYFNKVVPVTSFYRGPALNKRIGGSKTSQHMFGEAMDLDADGLAGVTNLAVFNHIRRRLPFDQLIWEFGSDTNPAWVHVSYKPAGNRGQVLRAIKSPTGKTVYKPFGP